MIFSFELGFASLYVLPRRCEERHGHDDKKHEKICKCFEIQMRHFWIIAPAMRDVIHDVLILIERQCIFVRLPNFINQTLQIIYVIHHRSDPYHPMVTRGRDVVHAWRVHPYPSVIAIIIILVRLIRGEKPIA